MSAHWTEAVLAALWALEAGATLYWRRRARRLEERVADSWLNYLIDPDGRKK